MASSLLLDVSLPTPHQWATSAASFLSKIDPTLLWRASRSQQELSCQRLRTEQPVTSLYPLQLQEASHVFGTVPISEVVHLER